MRTAIITYGDLKAAQDEIAKEFIEGDKCSAVNLARAYMSDIFIRMQSLETALQIMKERLEK